MAAAAASASDDDASTCFICLEPHSGPGSSQRLLHGGCACRGGSGFAHVACIAKAAQEMNTRMWQHCPTCKQMWTGQMELQLARARVASLASRPEGDEDRLTASSGLMQALLRTTGDYAEALSLGVATLTTARGALGDEHQVTLGSMVILAAVHGLMDNPSLALPLEVEALAVARRVIGNDHGNTMTIAINLARTHMEMGNYDTALLLMTENLERTRRLMGDDSARALHSMTDLAELHVKMGHHDLALPLYRDGMQRARRVLGDCHPLTLHIIHQAGVVLCNGVSDIAAGIALLEEAVASQTAVLGADHRDTRESQRRLDSAKHRENSEEQGDDDDDDHDHDYDDGEEETIVDRTRKRRRLN